MAVLVGCNGNVYARSSGLIHEELLPNSWFTSGCFGGRDSKRFPLKAKELHPDVNPSPAAHEQFLECQQAYAFLIDKAQRQNYDALLQAEKISEADLRRRELVYKLWVEHQQRKARTRTAMEAVRFDAHGNPLRRKIWKGVNLFY
ncbi:MAG: J domain-containing protein, partial [Flavobacteriales bacterium]